MENSISNYITSDIKLLPDVGNVVPYTSICETLFGHEITEIPRIELLNKGYVVNSEQDNNKVLYFKLSKFHDFIEFCENRINFDNLSLCPINYFGFLNTFLIDKEKKSINQQHLQVIILLNDFKEFLVLKDDINGKFILKSYWDKIFNGIVTSYNENPFLLTIKFKKNKGLPFILNISNDEINSNNTLSTNLFGKEQINQFDKLYNCWLQEYLMDTPENYVISCLELVTGSLDMATMIYKSHDKKENYEICVDDLNQIINFKSNQKKNSYLEYFVNMYTDNTIYQKIEEKVYLNFEGFNKYLLNIDASYLSNFQDKETINQMYYNVMDELINSYQKLYKHAKLV